MYYKSLTLKGCKRLLLKDIQLFVITPRVMIQLILGTNGSGKSSVLEELSPIPADKNDYSKDGMKQIVITKRGVDYILTTTFDPTKHSFVEVTSEGETELNPNGGEGIQLKLIYDTFHMDSAIHELMRGAAKFTEMGPSKRREWITRLSVADYDFAMSAYDDISKRYREAANALKRLNAHLVIETSKIISLEEEERLEKEVKELLFDLEILMSERIPLEAPANQFLDRRDRIMRELEDISMRLLRSKIHAPHMYCEGESLRDEWGEVKRTSFKSLEQLDDGINQLRHRLTASEAVIQQCTEQYTKLSHNYEVLLKAGQDGVQNLSKQFQGLEVERLSLLERRKLKLEVNDPVASQKAFDAILPALQELLESMPANEDRRFGRERMRVIQDKMIELESKRSALRSEADRLQAQIEHADKHRANATINCPECGHNWIAGIREDEYARAKELVMQHSKTETGLIKEIDTLRAEAKEMENYFNQYREFMGFVKNVVILEPFWIHLLNGKFVTDVPKEAFNQARIFQRDLAHEVQAYEILQKMDEISKLRAAAEQVGDANLQDVKEEMEFLANKLGMLTQQVTRLRMSITDYCEYRRQIVSGDQMAERVKALYSETHTLQDSYVEALRRESIIHCMGQIQQSLVLKQESLRLAATQKAIAAKLQEQVNELAIEEEALGMMAKELSPINGLIAEGLMGFINAFVGKMNAFIKKIWTYPLKVLPTGFSSDNASQTTQLDYKFKMVVGDYNNVVPDVSKGSDGIKEIVNLAFKMSAIEYLHLSDAPLLLDEFGRALDDAHRSAANHVIKALMDQYNHTQLFLVSHYSASYGSFTNAEVCVLDKSNIALPESMKYNEHVTIN